VVWLGGCFLFSGQCGVPRGFAWGWRRFPSGEGAVRWGRVSGGSGRQQDSCRPAVAAATDGLGISVLDLPASSSTWLCCGSLAAVGAVSEEDGEELLELFEDAVEAQAAPFVLGV
jgi:hypothetical protein